MREYGNAKVRERRWYWCGLRQLRLRYISPEAVKGACESYGWPRYIKLSESGELKKRALNWRSACILRHLPRNCGIDRISGERGYCHSGYLPIVASFCDHHGEEPVLSGARGSGTVFFGNCNLSCVYCQNHQISQDFNRQDQNEVEIAELARDMIYCRMSADVTILILFPITFCPQVVLAIEVAVRMGLHIPIIYNSSGYDALESIKALQGIVDITFPISGIQRFSCRKILECRDYVRHSRSAIKEMYRQAGELVLDESGNAVSGLIVRHLICQTGWQVLLRALNGWQGRFRRQ